jgi:transcriptional regulator with XRE-family HTH domain
MLTAYGKLIRKHRIDSSMTLRQMAQALEVTPAFLSAVETGKKPVPAEMLTKTAALLNLDIAQRAELGRAAELSRQEHKVRLDERASGGDRELAAAFARQFSQLTEQQKEELRKILEDHRG